MAQNASTIEQQVASAVLERKLGSITIDGETYEIAPPSLATLIIVSEIVSTLPSVADVPQEQKLYAALHYAKDFKALGDVFAVLLLGAKHLTERVERRVVKRRLWGLIRTHKTIVEVVDRRAKLAKAILEEVSPSMYSKLVIERLRQSEIGFFFGIITSLGEANLLKPTVKKED